MNFGCHALQPEEEFMTMQPHVIAVLAIAVFCVHGTAETIISV